MSTFAVFINDVVDYWPQILSGLGKTVLLASVISVTGFFGGILVFFLALSPRRWVSRATDAYISFFIGTPLIVLLFLMYFGLPHYGVRLSPFTVAVIGFTLNVSAYNARYLMIAYRGLDMAELEAARAQGFSRLQVFRWITLPQVLRLSVPSLTNQVILNVKDSSVAFLIQYAEFFAQIQDLSLRNFQFFNAYLMAGIVYLALVGVVVLIARWLERRVMLPGLRRI